jgi:hypothetical protein
MTRTTKRSRVTRDDEEAEDSPDEPSDDDLAKNLK